MTRLAVFDIAFIVVDIKTILSQYITGLNKRNHCERKEDRSVVFGSERISTNDVADTVGQNYRVRLIQWCKISNLSQHCDAVLKSLFSSVEYRL